MNYENVSMHYEICTFKFFDDLINLNKVEIFKRTLYIFHYTSHLSCSLSKKYNIYFLELHSKLAVDYHNSKTPIVILTL